MKVDFIVENWTQEKSYTDLCRAILESGHSLTQLKDFKKSDWAHWKNQCVVFQGSIQMSRLMKETLKECRPVAWMTDKNYLCSTYYSHFGDLLFNDKYALISLKELLRQRFLFYGVFGKETSIFLRPDRGDKTFQAQIVDIQDLDKIVDKDHLHDLVLVSTPKNIGGEYRFICSKNGIIAHSTYRYRGLVTKIPVVPDGARKKCEEVLKVGFYPDPVFCVDIVEDGEGNFWLLELNSFSSCGLYECDKKRIVEAVSQIALEDFTLDNHTTLF